MLSKTDKIVNGIALFLIIFLIGYKFMFKEILGDIIGGCLAVAGGIITARYSLNKSKKEADKSKLEDIELEKKRIKNITATLESIIQNSIIPQLGLYLEHCENAKKELSKPINTLVNNGGDFTGLDIDFILYLGKDDIIKICFEKEIEMATLFDVQFSLKRIIKITPQEILSNYIDTIIKIMKRYDDFEKNNEIVKTLKNISEQKFHYRNDSQRARLVAVKNIDDNINFVNITIEDCNSILSKLKKQ